MTYTVPDVWVLDSSITRLVGTIGFRSRLVGRTYMVSLGVVSQEGS